MRKPSLMQRFCCDSSWDLDGNSECRALTEWAQLQLLCVSLITPVIKIRRITFYKSCLSVKTKKGQEKKSILFRRKLEIIVSESKARIWHITSMFVLYIFINRLPIKQEIHVKADNHSINPQQTFFFFLRVANLWFKNATTGWDAAVNGQRGSYATKRQHCTRY